MPLPIGSHARCDVEIKRLRREVERLQNENSELAAALSQRESIEKSEETYLWSVPKES